MTLKKIETKNIKLIKELLGISNYDVNDFWEICPYSVEELKKSRKTNLFPYRHIGLLWYILAGYTADDARKVFLYKDHTTATHVTKQILYTLQNNKFGHPSYVEIINQLKKIASPLKKTSDIWVNYYSGLVFLENQQIVKILLKNKKCYGNK